MFACILWRREVGMSAFTLFWVALGLSMDAFAVAVTTGIVLRELKAWPAIKTGLFFGGFQAMMPVVGYWAGKSVCLYISAVDHWVVFGVLSFIGGKMIFDSLFGRAEEAPEDPTQTRVLALMAVATSIDALAVGVSFALVGVDIAPAALTIGLITFALCTLGVVLGKRLGGLFEKKATLAGGVILTLIGVRVLAEHLAG